MRVAESTVSESTTNGRLLRGPQVCIHTCVDDEEARRLAAALDQAGVQSALLPAERDADGWSSPTDVLVSLEDLPRAGHVLRSCGYALPPPDPSPLPLARPRAGGVGFVPRRISLWVVFVAVGVALGFLDRLLPWFR